MLSSCFGRECILKPRDTTRRQQKGGGRKRRRAEREENQAEPQQRHASHRGRWQVEWCQWSVYVVQDWVRTYQISCGTLNATASAFRLRNRVMQTPNKTKSPHSILGTTMRVKYIDRALRTYVLLCPPATR